MATKNKQLFAVVPGADSEAKRDGNDLMFVVCSKKCGLELKDLLQDDILLGEVLDEVEEI